MRGRYSCDGGSGERSLAQTPVRLTEVQASRFGRHKSRTRLGQVPGRLTSFLPPVLPLSAFPTLLDCEFSHSDHSRSWSSSLTCIFSLSEPYSNNATVLAQNAIAFRIYCS